MDGFRMTLGFSRNSSEAECADSEGTDEGTILVCFQQLSAHVTIKWMSICNL